MSFDIEQTREDTREAFQIQIRSELIEVILLECVFRCLPEENLVQPFSLEMNSETSKNSFGENKLKIRIDLSFAAIDSSEPGRNLFSLESAYLLTYKIADQQFVPTDAQIDAFKAGNAVFNCWPFARELAQSMTMRAGLRLPPIPLLRMVPKAEDPEISPPPQKRGKKSVKTKRPLSKQPKNSD